MKRLNKGWHTLEKWIRQRALRERWLILITVWVLLGLLFSDVFYRPLYDTIQAQSNGIKSMQNQMKAESQVFEDDNKHWAQKKEHMKKSIQVTLHEIDQNMEKVQVSLTGENRLAILHKIFEITQVDILSVTNEKPTPISQMEGLFEVPVRMTLEGHYFDVVDFLSKLEAMPLPWRFWTLDYQVESHPKARVHLKLSFITEDPFILRF